MMILDLWWSGVRPLSNTIAMIQIKEVGGGRGIAPGAQGDEERDDWRVVTICLRMRVIPSKIKTFNLQDRSRRGC